MKLPVYKLKVNDEAETGISFVSLVDNPAIDLNFQVFSKSGYRFKVDNEEKRIVTGALMVADMPIYRNDAKGEYFVVFDKPTIYQIVHKFFKGKKTNQVNEMHDPSRIVDGVYMFESFIIDKDRGINPPKGFEQLPDGSWYGSFKVENDSVWEQIKKGEFKGFSVEGMFAQELIGEQETKKLEDKHNELANFKTEIMTNLKEAFTNLKKEIFGEPEPEKQFKDAKLADGTIIRIDGEMAEGSAVSIIDADGKVTPAPDGDLTLEDGTVITCAGGMITGIKPVEEEKKDKAPATQEMNAEIVNSLKNELAKVMVEVKALKATIAQNNTEFEKSKEGFVNQENFKKLFDVVELIANEPKEAPAQAPQSFRKTDKQDKINSLAEAIKSLKNK